MSTIRSARRVSEVSVVWTVAASTAAIVVGAGSGAIALVVFGAVGYIDALGSIALVHHFRHAMQHDTLEDRFERRAHRIVAIGLMCVGLAAIAVSTVRLASGGTADPPFAGTVIAASSLVVLAALSARKRVVARQVPSPALMADSHLSAVGALQALVALAGIVATRALGWDWADATAALALGFVAFVLGCQSLRSLSP